VSTVQRTIHPGGEDCAGSGTGAGQLPLPDLLPATLPQIVPAAKYNEIKPQNIPQPYSPLPASDRANHGIIPFRYLVLDLNIISSLGYHRRSMGG
jgi:hypothetical protein